MDLRFHFMGGLCDRFQYGTCQGEGVHGHICPYRRSHRCVFCHGWHPLVECRRWRQHCRRRVVIVKRYGMPDQNRVNIQERHEETPAPQAWNSTWDAWNTRHTWG